MRQSLKQPRVLPIIQVGASSICSRS